MPNGQHKWAPQVVGSKPRANMNAIDREGLGRYVLRLARDNYMSSRQISEKIQKDYGVYIGRRCISAYIATFRDETTGQIISEDKLPNIPQLSEALVAQAQSVHEILEERQINDVNILEDLSDQEMSWFRDPDVPMATKLKVAKELRETIKLKLEMGGVVKPTSSSNTQNNFFNVDPKALEKILAENPQAVEAFREIIYMTKGRPDEDKPIDITPGGETP